MFYEPYSLQNLVGLFNLSILGNLDIAMPYMQAAIETLQQVRSQPSVAPLDKSPALLAFDPRVSRRLHTVIPIRVVELPDQDTVWTSLERLLRSWKDVDCLQNTSSLTSWQVILFTYSLNRSHNVAYL